MVVRLSVAGVSLVSASALPQACVSHLCVKKLDIVGNMLCEYSNHDPYVTNLNIVCTL